MPPLLPLPGCNWFAQERYDPRGAPAPYGCMRSDVAYTVLWRPIVRRLCQMVIRGRCPADATAAKRWSRSTPRVSPEREILRRPEAVDETAERRRPAFLRRLIFSCDPVSAPAVKVEDASLRIAATRAGAFPIGAPKAFVRIRSVIMLLTRTDTVRARGGARALTLSTTNTRTIKVRERRISRQCMRARTRAGSPLGPSTPIAPSIHQGPRTHAVVIEKVVPDTICRSSRQRAKHSREPMLRGRAVRRSPQMRV